MNETPKTILVVDDQRHQIETLCRGLFLFGYTCRGATGIEEASAILSRDPKPDLMITDLSRLELSGIMLIKSAIKLCPEMPILVIIGLARTDVISEAQALGIPILQKPFSPPALAEAIRAQLTPNSSDE